MSRRRLAPRDLKLAPRRAFRGRPAPRANRLERLAPRIQRRRCGLPLPPPPLCRLLRRLLRRLLLPLQRQSIDNTSSSRRHRARAEQSIERRIRTADRPPAGRPHDVLGLVACAGSRHTTAKLGYLETTCGRLGMAAVRFTPDGRTVSKLSRRPLDHAFVRGLAVDENAACCGVGGSDHVAMTFDIMLC